MCFNEGGDKGTRFQITFYLVSTRFCLFLVRRVRDDDI